MTKALEPTRAPQPTPADNGRLWASADLGTNTFRLLIAEEVRPGVLAFRELHQEVVRLGEGLGAGGRLHPPAVARAESLLGRYRARLDALGVRRRVGGLTAAGRTAADGPAFRARAAELLGGVVTILPGEEEARLSAAGALGLVDVGGRDVLFFDIGGGSTEVVSVRGGEVECATSLPVGVVGLWEALPAAERAGTPNEPVLRALCDLASNGFRGLFPAHREEAFASSLSAGAALVVATAGTPLTVAAEVLATTVADTRALCGVEVSAEALEGVWRRYTRLSTAERLALPAVEAGREDVILAGLALLRAFLERFRAPGFLVSDGGLLEGVLFDAVRRERGAARWVTPP